MKPIIFFILTLIFLGSACSTPTDKSKEHMVKNPKEDHQHDSETDTTPIELDNGEKWKADENTLHMVRKMEAELLAFNETDHSGYKDLADSLEKDIDLLVAGCTMKGKAHDQLHKWLTHHIANVKKLSTAENKTEAVEIMKTLEESFHVFNESFK